MGLAEGDSSDYNRIFQVLLVVAGLLTALLAVKAVVSTEPTDDDLSTLIEKQEVK